MAIVSSGQISLTDIQAEFGGSNPINLNEYYRGGAYVTDWTGTASIPTSGQASLSQFYGAASYPTQVIYKKTADFSATLSSKPKFAVLIGTRFSSDPTSISAPAVNGVTASTVINRSNTNLSDGHACGIFKINLGTTTSGSFNLTAADEWIVVIVENITSLTTKDTGYTNGDGTTISTGVQGFAVAGAVNNFAGIGSTITNCNSVYSPTSYGIVGVDTTTTGSNTTYNADGTSIQLTVAASFSY